MRLLNTETLQMGEFFDSSIPRYAILSHTWAKDEVLLRDMQDQRRRASVSRMAGWPKVLGTCRLARRNGFEWVWIDTCCIDKTSSAELSEAINSMYRWYQRASVCYTFLSDVPSCAPKDIGTSDAFQSSRWFRRAWTLQELLAPKDLHFYSQDWQFLSTREGVGEAISKITGIAKDCFTPLRISVIRSASVAQKMSWASSRTATRIEDEAYCLLGLFEVNIPLIYGEGKRAFYRLQQEILRQINDQSLFAWGNHVGYRPNLERNGALLECPGLFAESPSLFSSSGNIVPCPRLEPQCRLKIEHDGIVLGAPFLPGQPLTFRRRHLTLIPLQCRLLTDFFNIPCLVVSAAQPLWGRGDQDPSEQHVYVRYSVDIFLVSCKVWDSNPITSINIAFQANYVHKVPGFRPVLGPTKCIFRSLPFDWTVLDVNPPSCAYEGHTDVLQHDERTPGLAHTCYPMVVRLLQRNLTPIFLVIHHHYPGSTVKREEFDCCRDETVSVQFAVPANNGQRAIALKTTARGEVDASELEILDSHPELTVKVKKENLSAESAFVIDVESSMEDVTRKEFNYEPLTAGSA